MKKLISYFILVTLINILYCQPNRLCRTPCDPDSECINGLCVKLSQSFVTGAPQIPIAAPLNLLRQNPCPSQTFCIEGYCLPHYCAPCIKGSLCPRSFTCPQGFICLGNKCVRDCNRICPPGANCLLN